MNEERTLILQMLKDGHISVEEAQQLLDAVPGEEEAQPDAGAVVPRHIYIFVTEHGKTKANIKIPFSMLRVALKLGQTFGSMGGKHMKEHEAKAMEMLVDLDIDELLGSISSGDITLPYTVMDMDDDEKGQHIEVILQ